MADMPLISQAWRTAVGHDGSTNPLVDQWLSAHHVRHFRHQLRTAVGANALLGLTKADILAGDALLQRDLQQRCTGAYLNTTNYPDASRWSQLPDMPRSGAPSFTALLLGVGAPAIATLVNTPAGRSSIAAALADPVVGRAFALAAPTALFSDVIRACPELTAWTDNHGNTLAHHRVRDHNANKNWVDHMVALDHQWLLTPNAWGHTARDLIQDPNVGGASPQLLAHLDAKLMGKAVRTSAEVQRKIRVKSGSRKM